MHTEGSEFESIANKLTSYRAAYPAGKVQPEKNADNYEKSFDSNDQNLAGSISNGDSLKNADDILSINDDVRENNTKRKSKF